MDGARAAGARAKSIAKRLPGQAPTARDASALREARERAAANAPSRVVIFLGGFTPLFWGAGTTRCVLDIGSRMKKVPA